MISVFFVVNFQTEKAALASRLSHLLKPGLFLRLLFQEGKACVFVFGNFVASRQGINGGFPGDAGKVVKGHLLPAFELLFALVEEIFLAAFNAFYAVSHDGESVEFWG
ncbi:MAG: hypothetical protein NTZ46_02775 [Verrucomicrobia bacterium]|nr:hypothetical protein [Verrucomicrobiota bacterium]